MTDENKNGPTPEREAVFDNRGKAGSIPRPKNFVKVHLPGEWPWLEVFAQGDGWVVGRIDNDLVSHLHHYTFDDIVRAEWQEGVGLEVVGFAQMPVRKR